MDSCPLDDIRYAPTMKRLKDGFTLIELLVVISVILIASSMIFIGGNAGAGASLSSSQRIISGIAQGARGQAILKNAKTRLIIYNDLATDQEKYRRFFGLVYADPDDPDQANPTSWIAATQGTSLPEGIYFDPTLSATHGWSEAATMRLEYPRSIAKAEGSGDEFYYYEFNRNGTMSSSPLDFVNDWLVIRAGTLKPGDDNSLDIEIGEDQKYIISALIFRRSGTTTLVNDPDDIL
ncbi:MAG: prepilin-type N-terminal cleavage/methylation domain-containing protein [Lentimonas sp.]|jgi:prepilin-type N-terminal cleavage/methylation domain-containing protein